MKFNIGGRDMSIRIWDRNPLEDLFIGNKTTCCTAIGALNGLATPIYLLSKAWNVVELFDAEGNAVGMSRVFIGEIDGEYAIMMDNIELNNTYIKQMSAEEKTQLRNKFFEYMHKYAEQVTGKKDSKVYFYHTDTCVPTSDLEASEHDVKFIGKNPTETVYVNASHFRWVNPAEFHEEPSKWFTIPKNS